MTTNPTNAAELQSALMDAVKAGKTDEIGSITDSYAKHVAVSDPTVQAQLKEQAQATVIEMLGAEYGKLANKATELTPPTGQAKTYAPLYNKHAVGAPLDGKFESFSDFAKSVFYDRVNPSTEYAKKLDAIRNYQEKVPSEGGFLVPEEWRAGLLQTALESSVMRPGSTVVPMGALKLNFPAIDTTSNASSVYGGIVGYWTEEGADLAESQASFANVTLEAWKLTALAVVTNELVRDAAGGFELYVNKLFGDAISYFEDAAFLAGSGVGQPLGIYNSPAMVTVSKETSQAADTINWMNITKMYARMLPSSLSKAVWLVTPEAFAQLANMTVNVKNVAGTENVGGSAVWLPDGTGTPTLTLLGRPVIITEKAGLLGDLNDIAFVDRSMYLIGDRQQMTIDSSAHARFTQDKTVYRVIERVDGRPWIQSAITPKNGGPALSAFVNLEAR